MAGGCLLIAGAGWAETPSEIRLEFNTPKIVFIETYRASLVDPFGEPYSYSGMSLRKVIPSQRKAWPLIDGPGPKYREIREVESLRPNS